MTHPRCSSGAWALLLAGIVGGVAAQPTAKTSPLNMGASGQNGQIFQPDPKLAGKFLWKMYMQGASVVSQDNGYLGRLTGVTALLYQHGIPSARMKAPTATGNNTQQIIVANGPGRVMVWSLTQPGTTLEANKMTWYAKKKPDRGDRKRRLS